MVEHITQVLTYEVSEIFGSTGLQIRAYLVRKKHREMDIHIKGC